MLRTALVLLLTGGGGCDGPGALPPEPATEATECGSGGGTSDAPLAPAFPTELEFRVLEEGVTEWAEVPLGDASAVALRVVPPTGSHACVQLDTVEALAGQSWVTPPASWEDLGSYCRSCPQRVSVAAGLGFYVLPSHDVPPPPAGRLRVRAALRDCETFLPAAAAPGVPVVLRLQVLPLQPPPPERLGVIRLALVLTPGSVFFADEEARQTLDQAVQLVNQTLSPGRLRVEVSRTLHLSEAGLEPLLFTRGDVRELEQVLARVRTCSTGSSPDTVEVPIVFAGCRIEEDPLFHSKRRPLGRVTHIPGGFSTEEGSDGIFLAGTHCDAQGARFEWPATTVARLLTHELGHFLGLYHSVEEDGTPDGLSDTRPDNAMHFNPLTSSAQGFTPGQFQVMRRHPSVSY